MTTIAAIDGRPLLASSPIRWRFKEGVQPAEETFDMIPLDADALLSQARKPVTLKLESNDQILEIKNLWLMDVRAGDDPNIKRVRIADRRWFWKYGHTLRRYNVRRNVGFKRIISNSQQSLQQVVPEVWYARWSLKKSPNQRWEPSEVIDDLIKAAFKVEQQYNGTAPGLTVSLEITNTNRKLTVENLVVDESSDAAVARGLSYVPEASLWINAEGDCLVFSKASGGEKRIFGNSLPETVGHGHVELVSNELQRPKEINVLFPREVEVRFDFLEGDTVSEDQRYAENVLPSPDFQNGDIVQGTWITVDKALQIWGSPPGIGGNQLTHSFIQKAFIPFMDLWAALEITGNRNPNVDWVARIAALQNHYRRTYRINQRWMDRILSIRAYRIGVVDIISGSRGPAEAFSDYSILHTQRTHFKTFGQGDLKYATNENGYPRGPNSPCGVASMDQNQKPAPAEVSILDHDQGIIHIDYKQDPNRTYEMILPSHMNNIPHGNIKDLRSVSALWDSVTETQGVPMLKAFHKIAVILTAVPGSPNNEDQLHKVTVKPRDIESMLPASMRNMLGNARGPAWNVRLGGALEGARALTRWLDSKCNEIDKIFGVGGNNPSVDELVLNLDKAQLGGGRSGASLNEIAKAVAARIYASFADHLEGTMAAHLTPNIGIDGWIEEATVEIGTNGTGFSRLHLPDKIEELNLLSLLDASTRAVILREVQPNK